MNTYDLAKFNDALNLLAEMYEKKLSPGLTKFYWESLQGYGIEPILQALRLYAQDEKNKKFPFLASILQKLKPDNRDKRSTRKCYGLDCKEEVIFKVKDQNGFERGLCQIHYDKYKPKTEVEVEIDRRAAQFEQEAKELGLTNQQYFRKKFNITDGKNNVEAIREAMKK